MHIDPTTPVTPITLLDCFDQEYGCNGIPSSPPEPTRPTAIFRRQQLNALFEAYGIGPQPGSFGCGFFIKKNSSYEAILAKLEAELPEPPSPNRTTRCYDLCILFQILRSYRCRVLRSTDLGLILACPLLAYHVIKTRVYTANDAIRASLRPIEEVLEVLIDPDRRTFSIEHLVSNFGYPTENYEQLRDREFDKAFGGDDE